MIKDPHIYTGATMIGAGSSMSLAGADTLDYKRQHLLEAELTVSPFDASHFIICYIHSMSYRHTKLQARLGPRWV